MNTSLLRLLAVALLAGPAAAAPVVTIEGFVGRGAVPVTGVFTATIEVSSDAGDVLVAASEPSFELQEGRFAVTLDLADAAATLEAGETVTVAVDLGEGLTGSVLLGPVFFGGVAPSAARAVTALTAASLGAIPAADLVPDATLSVPMAFANLTALPAGIDDGVDNGTVDTLTGLAIVGGVLDVAPGGVTDIVANTLTGAKITDGTVSSTQLGALTADRLADGALTGANFASGAFATTADVTGTQLLNRIPPGCVGGGGLTTGSACSRRTCTTAGDCVANVCLLGCTSAVCENVGPNPSVSTQICVGPGEGVTAVGRLIKDP